MRFLVLLLALFMIGCAHGHHNHYHHERIGRVVAVETITRSHYVSTPQYGIPYCTTSYRQSNTGDVLLGAVIGAAIGNRIGGGSGRDIATAAGAVVGGSVASQPRHPRTTCYEPAYHRRGSNYGRVEVVEGYLVRISDRGYTHTIRMNHPPRVGSYIRY